MLFEDRSPAWRCCTGVLIAAAMGLLVSACGRRGPLEAPPSAAVAPQARSASTTAQGGGAQRTTSNDRLATSPASVTQDTPEDETDQVDPADSVLPTPTPAAPGSRKRGRAYEVPKQPFILDPLL